MLKNILILLIATFFISCGDSGDSDFVVDSNSKETISQDEKLAKNPNYELYNEKCEQTDNASLCGYVGEDGPPTLPCIDKTYCLPE
jgi:hypothetical protein